MGQTLSNLWDLPNHAGSCFLETCGDVDFKNVGLEEPTGADAPSIVSSKEIKTTVSRDLLKGCGLFNWLQEAVRVRCSDLFLADGEGPVFKIYGKFERRIAKILAAGELSKIVNAILSPEKLQQYKNGQEVDLVLDVPGTSRFRLNIFRHQKGTTIAIRPIPYSVPGMRELGLPPVFEDLTRFKRGLILITGPAGSGKSTTLASLINRINQYEERHIITIEDPIEYFIDNERSLIHQRQVGWHTASFSDGLRNALRENPDVIVVGEMRDLETIMLALRAAETGHLVLGTMHSGTAVQAITRLLDVFDAERQPLIRVQLAQSLQAVVSQRLFRKTDNSGMVVATEVLIATLAIRNIIRQQRNHEIHGYMETGMCEQMHTFKQSMQKLVDEHVVDASCMKEEE
ncbi:MAG: PilT/PilU family type 4a pilus ATPase [Candidatus Omnitrophica bacterium]|nr:PilT/PilU family type 4a pilus ATPase [Candidatus Omnitrophota bacterium]